MIIRVECYAGHRGEETPRRFFLGARPVEVVDVIDRWLAPDHRYFRVGATTAPSTSCATTLARNAGS